MNDWRATAVMLLATIALTGWLCASLAVPRMTLPGNAVEERVYNRLLGRQHALILFATLATAMLVVTLIAARSNPEDPDLRRFRDPCYLRDTDGQTICSIFADGYWDTAIHNDYHFDPRTARWYQVIPSLQCSETSTKCVFPSTYSQ